MINELIQEAKRMEWKEYVQGLDLSHWGWENIYPWSDREVVFVSDELIIYPVYPEDVLDDVNVSYEFTIDGIAISWDNFQEDCTILTDIPEEPIAYLLVEKVGENHWSLMVDKVFTEISELKEFLEEYFKNL
jgi:hypothetical protein